MTDSHEAGDRPVQAGPELPSGTLTFLFTDIEGSTRLLRQLGRDRYGEALATHRRLLRDAFGAAGGTEVDHQGDALFVVFRAAGDAIAGAVNAQRALHIQEWPAQHTVRVRMGVHTGEATLREGGYVGFAVHRAARVCAAAHGGQVLLSQTTADLVRDDLPSGVSLRELGRVQLKDLDRPERLVQLDIDGLLQDFPPLRTQVVRPPPSGRPRLLERDDELSELSALVATACDGAGGIALIEGPAGIGKTGLLTAVRDQAQMAAMQILFARGGEFEREFSYGIVRQLFEPVMARATASEREELSSGAAALATPLFNDRAQVDLRLARPDTTLENLHGLFWLMANLASRAPLLLAIDDLQWGDAPSLRWLAYVMRRLQGLPVLGVATLRPNEPGTEAQLLDDITLDPAVAIIRPAALSAEAVGRLLEEALATPVVARFRDACHATTGGNPLLLQELVRTIAREGIAPTADQSQRVAALGPHAVSRSVHQRLARLPPEAGPIAEAVAVLGDGSELEHAAALAAVDRDTAVDAAEALARADILRLEPPRLSFVHSVVRAALYDGLPLLGRERGHRRAAGVLADAGAAPERVAAHLLRTPPHGDAWAVAILREAARRPRVTADVAVSYLGRALAEPPDDDARAQVLAELGAAETLVSAPAAVGHLGQALPLIAAPRRRADVAYLLGRSLFILSRPEEAVAVFTDTIDELGDDDADVRGRLEAGLILTAISEPTLYGLAVERMDRLRNELPDAEVARKSLMALLAYHDARAGAPASEVVPTIRQALAGGTLLEAEQGGGPLPLASVVLAAADLDEALAVYDTLFAHAAESGSVVAFGVAKAFRTPVLVSRGALTDAEAEGREATELFEELGIEIGRGFVNANVADALMEQGDLRGAGAALARAGFGEQVPDTAHMHVFLASRARLRILSGALRRGVADTLDLGRRFEAVGGRNPAFIAWRSQAALPLLELGEREQARALAREEVDLARRWGAPRAVGRALRVAALTEGDAEGLGLLEESVQVLEGSPVRLEYAKSLTELGAALRRAQRHAPARDLLRRGVEVARRCGATPVAERAERELADTGAPPLHITLDPADALTPSERRVASMAVDGVARREIAQALFSTPQTVDDRLDSAYRKLGVSSRSELARALNGHGADPRETV